ncbi:MAG: hypothetical protein JWM16_1701 [Verrucomicrobiales bacterium]|nr:hypothetical protein [Verrucomicrobiales bacterium]
MKIHFARARKQFGPYESEQIEALLRSGTVQLTDDVWHRGAQGWVSLSTYLAAQQPAPAKQPETGVPKPIAGPPPIPVIPPRIPPIVPNSDVARMANDELEREILAGGRYVIFTYCFSVLIMSFKRPSDVIYLKPGESGFLQAFSYSLISLVAGWWGIPWGPIWTISTIFTNAHGGKDVTPEVLSQRLGPARASAILAQRGKLAAPGGMLMAWRYALWIGLGLLVANIVFVIFVASRNYRSRDAEYTSSYDSKDSGRATFEAANGLIDFNRGEVAFGNTPTAKQIATILSAKMKELDTTKFTGGNEAGISVTKHEFLTYCSLRPGQCVVLMHVPELRHYDHEAKTLVSELAWKMLQETIRSSGVEGDPLVLAVGIRGVTLYDRVTAGTYVPDFSPTKNGIGATKQGFKSKEELYAFFGDTSAPAFAGGSKGSKTARKLPPSR